MNGRSAIAKESTLVRHAIGLDRAAEWDRLVGLCRQWDVYHSAAYHKLAELSGDGAPILIAVTRGSGCIALPLLLRSVAGIPGLEGAEELDATSVYGYSGPICTESPPDGFLLNSFVEWLNEYLLGQGVVAAFSRLHPLLPQDLLVSGLGGTAVPVGQTVVLDLSLPEAAQWAQYRSNHRRDIRRAREAGLTVELDSIWTAYDEFIEIYEETMERVGASAEYFFSKDYFAGLKQLLGDHYRLFHVLKKGEIICSGLFSLCQGIVQYHLGGTSVSALRDAPMKLLFEEVRKWAVAAGARLLHLGGGVGGKEDSLFHFKTGFSKRRATFLVWQRIFDKVRYEGLVAAAGFSDYSADGYFPAYRAHASTIQR